MVSTEKGPGLPIETVPMGMTILLVIVIVFGSVLAVRSCHSVGDEPVTEGVEK